MSNNNEIKIKISADDFASQVLKNVADSAKKIEQGFRSMANVGTLSASSSDKAASSAQRMGQSFQSATNASGNMASSSRRTANSVQSMGQSFQSATVSAAGFVAAIAGFQGAAAIINKTLGSVVSFSRSMETNQIGIAGILSSMTTLNGQNLEWNQALGISKNLMRQLSDEALRTNATTEELTTTFRALLGPGIGAGMKVDEIIKLSSVGATAVKSLGLNGTQLVQELRDLVQGGIQPASSTLATALGLTDKDIKAAKASSEGLFNFLMKRLAGFEAAGDASKKTMDGIIDQIQEGIQRIGSQGTAPIFGAVKMELAEVANSLVSLNKETNEVQLSPDLVNDLTYISNKAVEIGGEFAEIGQTIGTVAVPAVKTFGDTLVFAGENAKTIITILGGLYAANKISRLYRDIAGAATGAVSANSFLGKAVLAVRNNYAAQAVAAKKAAAQEMQSAMQATTTINGARQARIAAAQNERIVTQGILRAERDGWGLVAAQIRGLRAEYMRLGASAEQAGAMQLQAARAAQGGQIILAQHIMATQRAHMAAAASATASATVAISGAGKAAGAIRTLGAAVWALAGGWVGVAAAIGYAIYQLYEFGNNQNKIKSYNKDAEVYYRDGKYYKRVWETGKSNDPNDRMRSGGGVNSGRYVERELSQGEYAKQYAKDQQEKDKAEELRKLESGEWMKGLQDKINGDLDAKFPKSNDSEKRKEIRQSQKVMNMAIAAINRDVEKTIAAFKEKIEELNVKRATGQISEADYAKQVKEAEYLQQKAAVEGQQEIIKVINGALFKDATDKESKLAGAQGKLDTESEKLKKFGVALDEVTGVINESKVAINKEGSTWRREVGNVDIEGLNGVAVDAISALSQKFFELTGKQMIVSSGKRDWGGHINGNKFDVVDDGVSTLLEENANGIRDQMIQYAKSIGLKVLDEYSDPSEKATAGHLDFDATNFTNNARQKLRQEYGKVLTQGAKELYDAMLKLVEEADEITEELNKEKGDISSSQIKKIINSYDEKIERFKLNKMDGAATAAEELKQIKVKEIEFAQLKYKLDIANEDFADAQNQLFTEFAVGSKESADVANELIAKFHELFDTKLNELNKQLKEALERGNDEDVRKIRRQIKESIDKIVDGFKALLDKIDAQTNEEINHIQLRKDLTSGQKDDLVEDARQRGLKGKIGAAENKISEWNLRRTNATDPEEIKGIDLEITNTKKQLEQLNYELSQTPTYIDKIHLAGKQGLEDGLNGFFYDLATGCKNTSDAFKDLANSILQSITKVVTSRLTQQLMGMFGLGAKPSDGGGGIGGGIGSIFRFADGGNMNDGGKVSGPGTGTSDSILAYVGNLKKFIRIANGEYVINAAAVQRFGTNFMDHINNGMIPPEIYQAHERYASGGSLSGTDIKIPSASTTNHVSVPVTVNSANPSSSMSSEMRREIENVVIKVIRKYS